MAAASKQEVMLNRVLYALLAIVAVLFYGELRRAWDLRAQALWDDRYIDAVRASEEDWHFGWRLEDLESRLHAQRHLADAMLDATGNTLRREDRVMADALARLEFDPDAVRAVECAARPGRRVHVGPDEFRDMSDRCHAFSGVDVQDTEKAGPQALFEVVHLDGDEASVGLRALSNGRFARVRAPPADAAWNAPWVLEFASPLPGLAERFQLKPMEEPAKAEPSEPPKKLDDLMAGFDDPAPYAAGPALKYSPSMVMIYSELMRGYLQCGGGGVAEPVRGFAGEAAPEGRAEYYFNVTRVARGAVRDARTLLAASRHARDLRERADLKAREAALASLARTSNKNALKPRELPLKRPSALDSETLKIAVVVPMTSRGTDMDSVEQSPIWFNLFASFVESVDWRKNRHEFQFYLGFDRGDALYDTGDAWHDMRAAFKAHARKALAWLGYGNFTVAAVVDGSSSPKRPKAKPRLSLKLVHFDDTAGAPSQAVSQMAKMAVAEGADYIYQLNDDTILVSKDWLETYVTALEQSPLAPNVGVAGPLDTTNERILTHAFVHKTHVEIFDAFFPRAFKNWWSDDWISVVYGRRATFARRDVVVTHNVQSQKTGAWNRYDVDHSAQHQLHGQVQRGFTTINAWLRERGHPVMPLPDVCGYAPMMSRIYSALMRRGL